MAHVAVMRHHLQVMLKAVSVFEALAKRMRDRFHVQAKSFARLLLQKLKVRSSAPRVS